MVNPLVEDQSAPGLRLSLSPAATFSTTSCTGVSLPGAMAASALYADRYSFTAACQSLGHPSDPALVIGRQGLNSVSACAAHSRSSRSETCDWFDNLRDDLSLVQKNIARKLLFPNIDLEPCDWLGHPVGPVGLWPDFRD